VPAEDGVGGDDGADLAEEPPPKHPPLGGEAPALVVVEQHPLVSQLLKEDPVLLPEVVDRLALPLVEPAGEDDGEDLESGRHVGRLIAATLPCPDGLLLCQPLQPAEVGHPDIPSGNGAEAAHLVSRPSGGFRGGLGALHLDAVLREQQRPHSALGNLAPREFASTGQASLAG
jgi:hypothetical protein